MQQLANNHHSHTGSTRWRRHVHTRRPSTALALCALAGLSLTATRTAMAQQYGGQPQRMQPAQGAGYDNYDDYETLTRGPLHEAFAEPISFNPEPGPLAPVAPPDPIPEVPPDYRPDGYNVQWIPGYWIWDDDINDYLWVSGIWRDIPPGREWVSGYWIQSYNGYRWIPGFWNQTNQSQTVYLPEPPVSIETGPNYQAAPSPDHLWISGSWIWSNSRYAWRPGYWIPGRRDWVWVPAHYTWTPRGYVFVDGYWDYDVDRRGVLFAPVRFQKRVYGRPQFRYSPRIVVDLRTLTDHLFLRPKGYHYYFGDYFDEGYQRRGYRPWFSAGTSARVYDPIYAHRRWVHRNDRDWDNRLRNDFDRRRRDINARPSHTWREQRDYRRGRGASDRLKTAIGKTLTQIVNRKHDNKEFKRIDDQERRDIQRRRQDVDRIRSQRRQAESRNDGKAQDHRYRTRTVPAHQPKINTPFRAKDDDKKVNPPKRPTRPEVKRDVTPRRRSHDSKKHDDKKKDDNKKDDDKKMTKKPRR
ncbi:MAG: YXWGXW repeat-containing protein [Phycisphaerales bacterium]|nr:YXWGXW repeat-containing protein [Phycisphaerales bacterium]